MRGPAELTRNLLYVITAEATSMGLGAMAESCGVPYDVLAWTTEWYFRAETLEAASAAIVNYHHRLPLARVFGTGTLSSSDGQRFPVKGGHATAALVVGKLCSAKRQQNALTAAIKEYGALRRTVYAARYLADETYRRRIARQLNKGENLHALRRSLAYAGEGALRRRHHDLTSSRPTAAAASPCWGSTTPQEQDLWPCAERPEQFDGRNVRRVGHESADYQVAEAGEPGQNV